MEEAIVLALEDAAAFLRETAAEHQRAKKIGVLTPVPDIERRLRYAEVGLRTAHELLGWKYRGGPDPAMVQYVRIARNVKVHVGAWARMFSATNFAWKFQPGKGVAMVELTGALGTCLERSVSALQTRPKRKDVDLALEFSERHGNNWYRVLHAALVQTCHSLDFESLPRLPLVDAMDDVQAHLTFGSYDDAVQQLRDVLGRAGPANVEASRSGLRFIQDLRRALPPDSAP